MTRITAFACALALMIAPPAVAQTDDEVEARLTPAVRACERAPEKGGTLDQALCYKDEAVRQDQRLHEVWKQVAHRLSPAGRLAMRKRERQWIKERDSRCHEEAAGDIGTTAAYMFNVCMANETIRRTMWLERVR